MRGSLFLLICAFHSPFLAIQSYDPQTTDMFASVFLSKFWNALPNVFRPILRDALKKHGTKLTGLELGAYRDIWDVNVHNDPLDRDEVTIDFSMSAQEVKMFIEKKGFPIEIRLHLKHVQPRIVLHGLNVKNTALFEAATVTLREWPDLPIETGGVSSVLNLPFLDHLVPDEIKPEIEKLVYPKKSGMAFHDGADLIPYLDPPSRGILTIAVQLTHNIPDKDKFGAINGDSDVYYIITHNGEKYRSSVTSYRDFGWDTATRVLVENPGLEKIDIVFFDEDTLGSDEYLAALHFNVRDIINGEALSRDGWYKASSSNSRARVLFHYLPVSGIGIHTAYTAFRRENPYSAEFYARVWVSKLSSIKREEAPAKRTIYEARSTTVDKAKIFYSKSRVSSTNIADILMHDTSDVEIEVAQEKLRINMSSSFQNQGKIQRNIVKTKKSRFQIRTVVSKVPEPHVERSWGEKDILLLATKLDEMLPRGVLTVQVQTTHNIEDRDSFSFANGDSDVYYILRRIHERWRSHATDHREFSWYKTLTLFVRDPDLETIDLLFWDLDDVGSDENLGYVTFALRDLISGELLSKDDWYNLKSSSTHARARIVFRYVPISSLQIHRIDPFFEKHRPAFAVFYARIWLLKNSTISKRETGDFEIEKRKIYSAPSSDEDTQEKIFYSFSEDRKQTIVDIMLPERVNRTAVHYPAEDDETTLTIDLESGFEEMGKLQSTLLLVDDVGVINATVVVIELPKIAANPSFSGKH